MSEYTSSSLPRTLLAFLFLVGAMGLTACTDVGVNPKSSTTDDKVFTQEESYKQFLAKLYGGLNVTGQEGPSGEPDIQNIDEGFSQYMRLYWEMQELPADAAVIAWSDAGIRRLNNHSWSATNQFSVGMYDRIFFQVSQVNEFLRQTADAKLDDRGVEPQLRERIQQYRAEARFLRALSYYHGIDLFGDIPLVTEDFGRGGDPPPQATRTEVFNFVVEELRAITDSEGDETLAPIGQSEYGRAGQGAAYMLLAKLYLNAEVYTGDPQYDQVIEVTNRIIDSGAYGLEDTYQHLFLADNHTADGVIFAIPQDGQTTQHYGGTTFLTHAPYGGSMNPDDYGIGGGWFGLRTIPDAVDLFAGPDERAIFYTDGQSKDIENIGEFTDGYAVPKYQNVTSTGQAGSNGTFPDTDFPMFRLAEAHLMYAEAVLRGGGGDVGRAVSLVNDLRERAGLGRDVSESDLTLDFLLDEMGRELFWEAQRRQDLIRFDQFTENGVWSWKGGVKAGTETEAYRNLYPLPSSELRANPNLEQNPGY
jgi:hypothetical protein